MKLRRILQPVAAALLAVGLVTAGVSPADAAPRTGSTSGYSTNDTGWGFK
jgi:hypothetical protein